MLHSTHVLFFTPFNIQFFRLCFHLTSVLYNFTADIEGMVRLVVINAAQTGSVVGFVFLSNCWQPLQPPLKTPQTATKGKLRSHWMVLLTHHAQSCGYFASFISCFSPWHLLNVCSVFTFQQVLPCVQFHPPFCWHKPHICDSSVFFVCLAFVVVSFLFCMFSEGLAVVDN